VDPARIAAPAPIQKPQPHGFPLAATLAPVVMSIVIWVVTRSAFALMFAALGPAVAFASVADARRQSRRQTRAERARFARELDLARGEVAAFHASERHELDLDLPSAASRASRGDHDPERWGATVDTAVLTVGRGIRTSSVELDVPATRDEQSGVLAELADFARRLDDAPVGVAARLGVAVVGPRALAGSVARGLVTQLASVLPPLHWQLAAAALPPEGHWLTELPHRLVEHPGLRAGELAFRRGDSSAVIVVASAIDAVPSHVRVVLRAGERGEIVRHPDRTRCGPIELEYVSREQARAWAQRLSALAGPLAEESLPEVVELADLFEGDGPRRGLTAPLGVGFGGACLVDLVNDGPHAVVGGTTGSGKSELLIAWVLGIAHAYPPTDVTFLLVDFKGGSSFAPLEHLPHCVGVISDLDEHSAVRALESLTAEVRLRERMLADARARSIDDLDGNLPRLVIVVDEFAAMVGDFPDLHALFGDLAARGRSLGLHLVLCTQRPAGVVRDAVLANAGLRISLRVNNRADSQAVIGTDAAADLPARPRGRALVSVAGESPRELQVALAASGDPATVVARWPGAVPPRRPWCDPLPTVVYPLGLAAPAHLAGIPFALVDEPAAQAQPTLVWHPPIDGHVLVLGGARSGKSIALAALTPALSARVVPTDPERTWDAVFEVLRDIRSADDTREATRDTVLVLDDLDVVLARLADEHAAAFLEALAAVLREGPGRGVHAVLATQRITPGLHAIVALCDRRLVLRMSSKQEHIVAGGAGEQFDAAAPPGRGTWDGRVVQVAFAESREIDSPRRLRVVEPPLAVVSSAPRAFAERARGGGASVVEVRELGAVNGVDIDPTIDATIDPTIAVDIVVGDAEAWQSRWGALQAVSASRPVFFDGCSLADFRLLTRSRVLPPPIVTSTGAGWLLSHGGYIVRARVDSGL
jgi:S-DNA-T family DNA segregation ATPase FtsK/SpoIIIE